MLRKQLSISRWQKREVFVILVLATGFPYTLRRRRRRSWQSLCYSSSGDSSDSSQRKGRRIWEESHRVQDLRKQPPAQRTPKLRFPWWYWFWDIYLRAGSNGVKVRKEWKKRKFLWWVWGHAFLIINVILWMKCEQICHSKLSRAEKWGAILQLQRKQGRWTKRCKSFSSHFWLLQFEIASNAKKIRTETGQYCRCIGYDHAWSVMGHIMNFLLKFCRVHFVF